MTDNLPIKTAFKIGGKIKLASVKDVKKAVKHVEKKVKKEARKAAKPIEKAAKPLNKAVKKIEKKIGKSVGKKIDKNVRKLDKTISKATGGKTKGLLADSTAMRAMRGEINYKSGRGLMEAPNALLPFGVINPKTLQKNKFVRGVAEKQLPAALAAVGVPVPKKITDKVIDLYAYQGDGSQSQADAQPETNERDYITAEPAALPNKAQIIETPASVSPMDAEPEPDNPIIAEYTAPLADFIEPTISTPVKVTAGVGVGVVGFIGVLLIWKFLLQK